MKKEIYKVFRILSLLCLLITSTKISGQDNKENKHRYLGLGVNLNNYQSGLVRLTVDPIRNFRLEIQYGSMSKKNENSLYNNGTIEILELTSKSTAYGIAGFATFPIGNAIFYGGFKYQQNNEKYQSFDQSGFPNYTNVIVNNSSISKRYGPSVGAEFRFGNRFALGADFSYLFGKDFNMPGSTNSTPTTDNNNLSQTNLFFRFFLF